MTRKGPQHPQSMSMVQDVVRSPGSPLTAAIRRLMEARFNRDLSHVRLHTDDRAAASARALGAWAYAVGSHIVFGKGRHNPGTRQGLWLLAHELTHVIQQRGNCSTRPVGVAAADNVLERAADQAADLVAANRPLPRDFAFGTARAGVVQCHQGPPCGGYAVAADPVAEQNANLLLEFAYRGRPEGNPNDIVVYASNNYAWQGASGGIYAYANELLNTIRGWPPNERPYIINFTTAVAYFFVRSFEVNANIAAITNRFYQTDHRIATRYNQLGLDSRNAGWYPDHVLLFPGDPAGRFVCTEQTNHSFPPYGVILYDIRGPRRQRKAERRARVYYNWEFEPNFRDFEGMAQAWLPKKIRFYDPDRPDYVILVPPEFWELSPVKEKARREWEQVRIKLPIFADPRGSFASWQYTLMFVGIIVGVGAGGIFAAAAEGALAATFGATVAMVPTGVSTGVTTGGAIEVVIAYEAAGAGVVAPAMVGPSITTAQVSATSVTAFQAMMATPAVKAVTTGIGAAGTFMVLSNAAQAAPAPPGSSTAPLFSQIPPSPATVALGNIVGIKAVPINDFQQMGGAPHAFSAKSWNEYRGGEPAKGEFGLGRLVYYDNIRHMILGRFSVK